MYLQDKVLTIIVNNEVLYQSNGLNGKSLQIFKLNFLIEHFLPTVNTYSVMLVFLVKDLILFFFEGKITTTNCNLMVGGSPFSNDQKYIGYMDEVRSEYFFNINQLSAINLYFAFKLHWKIVCR